MPIVVAAWSKAWTVFDRSNTEIVGSHPTGGMDVYVRLFCVCVVLDLQRADPPSTESYRLCIGLERLKRRPRLNKRAVEHNKKNKASDFITQRQIGGKSISLPGSTRRTLRWT
jgi:hypothetical protein